MKGRVMVITATEIYVLAALSAILFYLIGYYRGRHVESMAMELAWDESSQTVINSHRNQIEYLRGLIDRSAIPPCEESDDSEE